MPQRSSRPAILRAAAMLVLALAAFALPGARAAEPAAGAGAPDTDARQPAEPRRSIHAPALKRQQQRLLLEGAKQRMARARALARLQRTQPEPARSGARIRRPRDWSEAGGPQGTGVRAPLASAVAPVGPAEALAPDVLVNNRLQDAPYPQVGQAEQMIAALGQNVLVAWNDGLGFQIGGDTQGYGYSVDGGLTYTDGGAPPAPVGWRWTSDPIVAVNEKTGDFWYCALVDVNSTQNGVAVMKARFNAGTVQWSPPTLVRVGSNSSIMFDKPWLAADSLSNRLYLSYTVFTSADTIVFQRSSVGGTTWDSPQRLSSNAEAGYVQGSRPAVGPDGEVYVVWYSIGIFPTVVDYMKVRKSTNQGASFGAAVNVASMYSNFGSGAPGFNRGIGISYPAIAADRSLGARRGRAYVGWNESVNFYDDYLGTAGSISETESNEVTADADTFTIGKIVRGSISSALDFDYFRFNGTAGQTVLFFADSISSALNMSLRVFCTDGSTRLAFSAPGAGQQNFICFTLPASGAYYMRCASLDNTMGSYRIATGFAAPSAGERARDHRDVFVTWSDGGTTWSTPARASDSPAGFDDWLPEVAVGGDNADPQVGSGRPYCLWYDWRDSPSICGGGSHVYLSRSDDGGTAWTTVGSVTSLQTAWTSVGSNILPNQGDYLTLFVDHANLYAAWADGRNGDPDVYAVTVPLLTTPAEIVLASVRAEPDRVTLTWYVGARSGFTATVERREATTVFTAVGGVAVDGAGSLTFVDATVAPGGRYAYRLAWFEGSTQRTTGEVWVDVPVVAIFALHGTQPNPAVRDVLVSFTLPDDAPATLELLDVTGRRVCGKQVAGAGPQLVNVSEGLALEPGLYLVRLTRGSRSLTTRVTVIR